MNRRTFATMLGAALVAGALPRRANAATYAAGVAAIRAEIERDRNDPLLARSALPRLYEHGHPVERAVVLFHGFTNSPQQFDELARLLYDRGCNVYVPRIPFHGYADRLTRGVSNLTVASIEACATSAYDVASGLGTNVSALGLSLGGTMALRLAQLRPLDLAIPVAPFLMPIGFPRGLGMAVMRALAFLPDMYWWWDPRIKENNKPDYAYPGFTTHSLATIVFFGADVFAHAENAKALARRCTLVTNANESAVNNGVARELFGRFLQDGTISQEVVLSGLGSPRHDIIDPTTFPAARTLVYPRLAELLFS